VPNGGFNGFYYCTSATGTPQAVSGAGTTVGGVSYRNGQPYLEVAAAHSAGGTDLIFHVAVASVERLLLPPFIFADQHEMSTGLFGVQNFQVQMNMAPTPARTFRVASTLSVQDANGLPVNPFTLKSSAWSTTAIRGFFPTLPTLSVQFLTPALDLPLPPKNIVPYMEFPRYIATPQTAVSATSYADYLTSKGTPITSQTITLPNIPDLLLIYVKPSAYGATTLLSSAQGDWSLPITNISMNFDNFSGLLSNATQEQLYQMSVRNGVDMDWSEWTGLGSVPFSSSTSATSTFSTPTVGGFVGLVGGPLVLRPGVDFALQTGQAPGLVNSCECAA